MAVHFSNGKRPKVRPGRRESIHQAVELQRIAFVMAKSLSNGPTDAKSGIAYSSLVRAWDIVQERKRILRGLPLPGSLKLVAKVKQKRSEPPAFKESLSSPEPCPLPQPADPSEQK